MDQPLRLPRQNKIFLALCANVVLLGLILLAVWSRGNSSLIVSPAFGQMPPPQQQPIAGGGGLFVMPAQLSPNTWGCYLLDVGGPTLCVYQYSSGEKMLRLTAARNIEYDRFLGNFNTAPPPSEIKDLAHREKDAQHENVEPPASKSPEVPKN